jgi:hypothetical protein
VYVNVYCDVLCWGNFSNSNDIYRNIVVEINCQKLFVIILLLRNEFCDDNSCLVLLVTKCMILSYSFCSYVFAAGVQRVASVSVHMLPLILNIMQRFDKHCNCHLQGECVEAGRL